MSEQPIKISSVTPYDERPQSRTVPSPRLGTALGFGWLLVAGLAVAASFGQVYSLTISEVDSDGQVAGLVRYTVDEWGRAHVAHSGPNDFSSVGTSGPRYGMLLCIAAGITLLGWLQTMRRKRPSWQPTGSVIGGVGSVFLLGVVACQLVATAPQRQAIPELHQVLRFGLGPWLAGATSLLGISLWAAQHLLAGHALRSGSGEPLAFACKDVLEGQARQLD